MAKKQLARKNSKTKPCAQSERLHDIMVKINSNQKQMDAKLAEIAHMCFGKEHKAK